MDQTFLQIKDGVTQWAYTIKTACPHVVTNIIVDTDKVLRVFFENEKYIAELVVEDGDFSPYRYVKMEILPLASKHPAPTYLWYDTQNDNVEKIITNLQIGLNLFSK